MATRYKTRITILEDTEIEELYGRPRGAGWRSTFRNTGRRWPCIRRLRKLMNTRGPTPPLTTMKRNAPRGLIAEIILRLKRRPVTRTIGVWPRAAQVLPL